MKQATMPTVNEIRQEISRRMSLIKKTLIVTENEKKKTITLPDYGEVKIVCHDGRIKTIETTIKEQM
jgi:hypothetical protein